jgi:5-methylcytosine-specific restriction endonuclease McrA
LGQPINLEVHHINGDRTNNELENLQLLCPNCHSYTYTFAKKGDKREKSEEEFVEALKSSPNIRQALLKLDLAAKGANYERAWELI